MAILELRTLKKQYDNGQELKTVINDISLSINEGDFLSIMGPSGSGKSTLLYLMSGILACDSGEVLFAGSDLRTIKEKDLAKIRRDKMGFVFQQAAFLNNLTILDNILLPAFNNNNKDKKALVSYAQQLMQQLGIADLADRKLSEVSGGQLQRAGIARALINKPLILFADEPTGALNSKTSTEIMQIFQAVNQEKLALVIVTHDRKVAANSDKVLFLVDGKIEHKIDFNQYNNITMEAKIKAISHYMDSLQI